MYIGLKISSQVVNKSVTTQSMRGETGAAACRELLPAADGGSAGLLVGGRSKRRR